MRQRYWFRIRSCFSPWHWLIMDKGWIEMPKKESVQADSSELVEVSKEVWSKVSLEGEVWEYLPEHLYAQQIL